MFCLIRNTALVADIAHILTFVLKLDIGRILTLALTLEIA